MGKFQIILEPAVIVDIQEAVDFYEREKIGLGEEFEICLNNSIETLQINPFFQNAITKFDVKTWINSLI